MSGGNAKTLLVPQEFLCACTAYLDKFYAAGNGRRMKARTEAPVMAGERKTITVKLEYCGRAVPLSVDEDWY